jgi:hypothetical protein
MVKILVGCPTSEHKAYCLKEYAAGIKALQGEFDILLVDNTKDDHYLKEIHKAGLPVVKGPWLEGARDRIVASRNVLRQKVLDEGYDWYFSLEQDVIPPPDALARLLAHNKGVVSGVYTKIYHLLDNGKEVGQREKPLLMNIHNGQFQQMEMSDLEPPRLAPILASGLGCILMHRTILEKVTFRWDPQWNGFDDMFFCRDVRANKFGLWADTSIRCKHLEMDWKGIKK